MTDAPKNLDWCYVRRKILYRSVKKQLALKPDGTVMAWFKALLYTVEVTNSMGHRID